MTFKTGERITNDFDFLKSYSVLKYLLSVNDINNLFIRDNRVHCLNAFGKMPMSNSYCIAPQFSCSFFFPLYSFEVPPTIGFPAYLKF